MMVAAVRALGYVIVETTDLAAWERFGSELLGLHLSVRTPERLEFRADQKEYRLVVELGSSEGMRVAGWEVAGPSELAELADAVDALGYPVTRHSREEARARRVSGLASFTDPDGIITVELHYGLRESNDLFVSPNGARFVTGSGGLGHLFQSVSDEAKYWELYVDTLGFRLADHIEKGANGEIDLNFFYCNPRHHSLAFAHIPGVPNAIGHLMLEVTDMDVVGRAWEKVSEHNAAPILSTLGRHTNDKMISFYVRSPSEFGLEFGTGGLLIDEKTWLPTRYSEAHYWGHNRVTPTDPADPADNS